MGTHVYNVLKVSFQVGSSSGEERGGGLSRHRTTMTNYYLNHACYYYSKFRFRNYYTRARAHKEKGRRWRWRFVVVCLLRVCRCYYYYGKHGADDELEYRHCRRFICKVITVAVAAVRVRSPTSYTLRGNDDDISVCHRRRVRYNYDDDTDDRGKEIIKKNVLTFCFIPALYG